MNVGVSWWSVAVVNLYLLAVCGFDHRIGHAISNFGDKSGPRYEAYIQRDMSKRIRGMEDRLMYLMVGHRNMTATMDHLKRRVHHVAHRLNGLRDEKTAQDNTINDMSDRLNQQHQEISRLKQDNIKLNQKVEQLSNLVERLLANGKTLNPLPTNLPSVTTAVDKDHHYPKDCQTVFETGGRHFPGDYYIMVKPTTTSEPFNVCCHMTNNSGWTVIQRRMENKDKGGGIDFYRKWNEYKEGFGDIKGEFWLGNDRIHSLTTQGDYRLRIEMETWENKYYYAEYEHFSISSESDLYRLHISGYHGTAGDSLTVSYANHDNQPFSTWDKDNDSRFNDNCAKEFHGAWWFKNCFQSHLNGRYYQHGEHEDFFQRNGIHWKTIHLYTSLKYTAMMIKPNDT